MEEFYKKHALCVHTDCEMADVCLRTKGYKTVNDDDRQFPIINPNIVSKKADCAYFAKLVTVKYAKGFKAIFNKIPAGTGNTIYHNLSVYFGKNPYYARRNGNVLISPDEQEYIREFFHSYGVEDEVFDGYEDREEWG